MASLIILLGLFAFMYTYTTLRTLSTPAKYDKLETQLAIGLIFIVVGIYVYYLVRIGLWNFKNTPYLFNILLLIGLSLNFIFSIFMIYDVIFRQRALLFTAVPFVLFAMTIGIYDSRKFYQSWKTKRL